MISYATLVHNERDEIECLLTYLIKHKSVEDEIVIMLDSQNATKEVRDYVEDFVLSHKDDHYIVLCSHPLKKDFAKHKNYLSEQCSKDWIFLIDADEYPDEYLIDMLPTIIKNNPEVEAFWVPRINQVDGITGQQESNLIDALKIACRKFTKEKTGKRPYTNINLVRI